MTEIKRIQCNTRNYETKHELIASHGHSYCEVADYDGLELASWYED
jgi:hypothetical protein